MSKIEQLKKQYPNLSISLVDLAKLLDITKSHKYTPVICKIISENFKINEDEEYQRRVNYIKDYLSDFNISSDNLSIDEMWIYKIFLEHFTNGTYDTIYNLMHYGERGLLPTKDILTYKSTNDIKKDITFASLLDNEKNFSNQIVKEFENETWLAIRPLTYSSSIKYGAATKWCTTSRYEKEYFAKYWDRGVLVYFINKKTGYKFAGFKGVKNNDELSFWSAEDNRIDSLDIDCDSYLYDIIKNIFKSNKSNSDLCDLETKSKVSIECKYVLFDDEVSNLHKIVAIEELPEVNHTQQYEVVNLQNIRFENDGYITDTTYLTEEILVSPTMRG